MSWIENPEIKIVIAYFENITTHTTLLDVKNKVGKFSQYELLQVHDDKMEFRVPSTACAMGHQVEIILQAFSDSHSYPLKSRAKILQLTSEKNEPDAEIMLELHNKGDVDYQRFYELLLERQEQVSKLFKAVKCNE